MAASLKTPSQEDVRKSLEAKDHGNAAFVKGDFAQSVKSFTSAIEHDPTNCMFYSNRSAAYFKLGDFENAAADGKQCVEINPEFAKGYSRYGVALTQLKKYAEAVKIYAIGLTKDPSDRLLTDGLATAQKHLASTGSQGEAKADGKEEYVVGIDLGTTYSCVGVWKGDKVVMVPNDRGLITTPSFVSFTNTGKRSVGHAAKSQAAVNPRGTIYDIKRVIGQRWSDPGVAQDCRHFAFTMVEGSEEQPLVEVDMGMHGKKRFAPEEISAMVLGYLKKTAEAFLKVPVTKAVITVPAYFNDSQRNATKAAGKIAGLDVLRIINEPTAAALSYGLDMKAKDKESTKVLIFDLGGGTFDVSILTIENGIFEVKATGGDTRLGGEDFDNRTVEYLMKEVESQGLPDITKDERAMKRLRVAAEKAKRALSQGQVTDVFVEGLTRKTPQSKPLDFKCQLTRERFEKINQSFFVRCLETVRKVLKDAKMKETDIDEVVLVGGSTRIPKIQSMLQEQFGGKELCRSLNPDEAVAYGAAVQGAILNGKRNKTTENFLLMDVTPLSLGIETTGRVMSVIIPRNTPIPCVKTQTYTTEENYQTQVDISVYEGERPKTDQNNLLGKFTISGIERAKRGEPKIDVSFSLDSNGILNVKAKDQKTGTEAHIEISSSGRASDRDIERMVKEAEQSKREDQAEIQKIEAQNEFEALIYQIMDESKDSNLDGKAAAALAELAEEAQKWLDENFDNSKAAQIAMRRRTLERAAAKHRK